MAGNEKAHFEASIRLDDDAVSLAAGAEGSGGNSASSGVLATERSVESAAREIAVGRSLIGWKAARPRQEHVEHHSVQIERLVNGCEEKS
jgi:hypothetical protein